MSKRKSKKGKKKNSSEISDVFNEHCSDEDFYDIAGYTAGGIRNSFRLRGIICS